MVSPNSAHAAQRISGHRSVRLAACVAHEVRTALASIIYSADFLDVEGSVVPPQVLRDALSDIGEATRRLQLMSESLLELAGLGPAVAVPVSLRGLFERAQALLLSFFRDRTQGLRLELSEADRWVRGNPLILEQVVLHAVLSAATSPHAAPYVRSVETASGCVGLWIGADDHTHSPVTNESFAHASALVATQGGALRVADEGAPGDALFWLELPRSEGPR